MELEGKWNKFIYMDIQGQVVIVGSHGHLCVLHLVCNVLIMFVLTEGRKCRSCINNQTLRPPPFDLNHFNEIFKCICYIGGVSITSYLLFL